VSVIPSAASNLARDDPARIQRTDERDTPSQSAIRFATASFALPPVGDARQLTTHRCRHGSQASAFLVLLAFTQSGIRAITRGGPVLHVLAVTPWFVKELTDELIRENHRSYEGSADSGALGVGGHTQK
jgi:hypothetical protein